MASATKKIAFNTAVQVIGKIAITAVAAVSVAIITRYLGPTNFGKFNLALIYMQIFGILADVGLFTIAVRELSRRGADTGRIVGNVFALRLVLSIAVVLLAGLLSLFLPYTPDVRLAIVIVAASVLFGLMNSSLVTVFQAKLQMQYSVISDTVGRLVSFLAVLAVVGFGLGFYAVVATAAIGSLATLLISAGYVRRLVRFRLRFDRALWKKLFLASVPLGLAIAINQLYFRVDTIMLSFFRSYHEVGIYSLAYKVLDLLLTLPGFFINSVFPLLTRYVSDNDKRVPETIHRSFDIMVMFGVPIAVGGFLLAEPIIRLVGGPQYLEGAVPLRILLVAASLSFLNMFCATLLIVKDKLGPNLILSAVGLGTNVVLNIIFIPMFGMVAAAANTLISEAFVLLTVLILVRRFYGFVPRPHNLKAILGASLIMGLAIWPLRTEPALLGIAVGAAVYGGLLYWWGGIDRSILSKLRA